LRGLEQARRSALAHHVYRIASMGARVLINGTRYKSRPVGCMTAGSGRSGVRLGLGGVGAGSGDPDRVGGAVVSC
jgi:hypothetical protein